MRNRASAAMRTRRDNSDKNTVSTLNASGIAWRQMRIAPGAQRRQPQTSRRVHAPPLRPSGALRRCVKHDIVDRRTQGLNLSSSSLSSLRRASSSICMVTLLSCLSLAFSLKITQSLHTVHSVTISWEMQWGPIFLPHQVKR